MKTTEPHHIIAIGASAGSMEEINSFFDHTPLDGVSYVIVQHLSPDFKSMMINLLAKHSKLKLNEAEDGMPVICNQVYLIPNDKFMTIRSNKLHLTDKEKVKGPHLTINRFFNSLADDIGEKAIGIILSGMGKDGSEGISSIKNAGGMVIARSPETSPYASMPSNAIATGSVDFILEPAMMPQTIEDYVNENGTEIRNNEEKRIIPLIVDLIKDHSPLDFSEYKINTIIRRTKSRALHTNFTTLSAYYEFLKTSPAEINALAREYLINVTSFFRDKEAFDVLETVVIPDLIAKLNDGDELKIWVAGCATGEEVYSIAILIHEHIELKHRNLRVKIFATDIETVALAHAGKGIYGKSVVNTVSPERIEKYFLHEGTQYHVKQDIRKMILFARHDLSKNPPYCNMQLISCRNLLIYMTPVLQKKIFNMLLFGLKTNGYLFLGSSENPVSSFKNLELVSKKWKIYKNIEVKQTAQFDSFTLPELLDIKQYPVSASGVAANKNATLALSDVVTEKLAEKLGILVVCIDEHNNVLHSYGDTSKFLLQKNFKANITDLLPGPLFIAFNTISKKALKLNKEFTVNVIKLRNTKENLFASLTVTPLRRARNEEPALMLTFTEDRSINVSHEDDLFDEKNYFNEYTLNLEDEVRGLKLKLQAAHEQLDASNENMQSFNEELLSANEEMQSTNEEMQSVNEELETINSNYQLRNKELIELNDDLNNYFRSNLNGQLVIDNELHLVKFSPGTVKQINLQENDVGRPLSNISTNIKFETIIDDIKQVIDKGSIITKEIETNNGKWYQLMTMPYIHEADNSRTGAIITFNDITELKNTQIELNKKNTSLQSINADLDNFVHTASHDLLAPLANIEISINVMKDMKPVDVDYEKFLEVINSSIKKFRGLIREIATIAKLESDAGSVELVDMNELIDDIVWSLNHKIKPQGVIINRNLEVKHIRYSKKNLRSILFNLISNAIKFKREDPPVVNIQTTTEGGEVVLTVQDNGIGISVRHTDKIFEMYGRVHHQVEGQGIGLFLAKKMVDATGGSIEVESVPGKGSKFIVRFKSEALPVPDSTIEVERIA